MLREIIVLKGKQVIFKHEYGRTLSWDALSPILNSLIDFIFGEKRNEDIIDFMNIVNYRLAYLANLKFNVLIIFITDLTDKEDTIKTQISYFATGFFQSYGESLDQNIIDPEYYKDTKYICDEIFKELRPKIALIGFSGVGKTTITKLIRAEDIPLTHVPTITGDVAAIRVGDLPMFCWDFAGQEQFSFIWSRFVKGSDAIILVVDSTKQNLRESKFFVDLIKKEAPKTRVAIVANKQDLPEALRPEEIADKLGYRTYPLIAIDPEQRSVMLNIIADVVEVTAGTTSLIQPMLERDRLMEVAEVAIMQGNILKASETYKRIGDLSNELGEDQIAQYFYEQSRVLAQQLQSMAQKVMEKRPIEQRKAVETVPPRVEIGGIENSKSEGMIEENGLERKVPVSVGNPATGSDGSMPENQSFQPTQPVPTAQPAQPVPTAQPTQPVPTAQPAQPVPTAQPTQPVPTAQPAQPVPTAQPAQPVPTAQPAQPVPTAQPAQPVPTAQPTQPVPTAQPTQPVPTAQPTQPVSVPSNEITKEVEGEKVDEKEQIKRLEEELMEINKKVEEMKANIQSYDSEQFKKLMMEYEDKKNRIHRQIMDLRMEIIKKLTM
ncbi:MAG: ADP-ribosylation factor-like protein [Candidatus Helarchaeota archaeon]